MDNLIDLDEVDFVIREHGRVSSLIQVCWDLSDPRTKGREFRALLKAGADLRCNNLLCLTRGMTGTEAFSWDGQSIRVRMLPIEEWLTTGPA